MRATAQQPQRAPDGAPPHYERHRPEQTTLYPLVRQHAASFIAYIEASTGAELVTPLLQVVQRVLTRHLLGAAGLKADEGQGGAVTLIQCFGSAANLNTHMHCLVLDGVYRSGADGPPAFIKADAPTDDELRALLQTVLARLMKMLTRRGVLIEEMGQTYLAELDADGEEARTLRPLQAAAITYRIAFGPRAGQKVLTLAEPHQLAAASQARVRHRHAALPELRRRGAEDHRDCPGSDMKSLTPSDADGPERLSMAD